MVSPRTASRREATAGGSRREIERLGYLGRGRGGAGGRGRWSGAGRRQAAFGAALGEPAGVVGVPRAALDLEAYGSCT